MFYCRRKFFFFFFHLTEIQLLIVHGVIGVGYYVRIWLDFYMPFSGIILRPGFIYGTRSVGSMKIPLGIVGSPLEMVISSASLVWNIHLFFSPDVQIILLCHFTKPIWGMKCKVFPVCIPHYQFWFIQGFAHSIMVVWTVHQSILKLSCIPPSPDQSSDYFVVYLCLHWYMPSIAAGFN